jgi:hypothetical protein
MLGRLRHRHVSAMDVGAVKAPTIRRSQLRKRSRQSVSILQSRFFRSTASTRKARWSSAASWKMTAGQTWPVGPLLVKRIGLTSPRGSTLQRVVQRLSFIELLDCKPSIRTDSSRGTIAFSSILGLRARHQRRGPGRLTLQCRDRLS